MILSPRHAWLLRRLLTGKEESLDVNAFPQSLRDVVQHLLAAPLEERQFVWGDFSLNHPLGEQVFEELVNQDPDGPEPEDVEETQTQNPRPEKLEIPISQPRLRQNRVVMAKDKDNFGHVIEDFGHSARVHFRSEDGVEARVTLSKDLLRNQDGSPLTDDFATGSNDQGWGPLPTIEFADVPEFPLGVLPAPMARLVTEGSEAIGCPPDFLAVAALAVASAAIGRSIALEMKSGYVAGPALYLALVGLPSDGKSPALKAAVAPIRQIDQQFEAEYWREYRHWQERAKEAKKQKEVPPPCPEMKRVVVDDITMETIPAIAANNPRGLLCHNDELASLSLGLNQYKGGKGNDRQVLMKLWSGDTIKKDRVGQENNTPITCHNPFMTIVGAITPDNLDTLSTPQDKVDGFLDRFLFCYPNPRPVPHWTERGISQDVADGWAEEINQLWARTQVIHAGIPSPHIVRFSPEAKDRWRLHYDQLCEEMNAFEDGDPLRGTWGKLREYAGRLTLLLSCLHHAATPFNNPQDLPSITAVHTDDAWALIDYFKQHAKRVRQVIRGGAKFGMGSTPRKILDWIRDQKRTSFSLRDLKQARRNIAEQELEKALKTLIKDSFIKPRAPLPTAKRSGRPPSQVYDVHPNFLAEQRETDDSTSAQGESDGFEECEGFE